MKRLLPGLMAAFVALVAYGAAGTDVVPADSVEQKARHFQFTQNDSTRYAGLTESDFQLVSEELGVEPAVIKAVVSVEAGRAMKGFWGPGIPIVNFSSRMFARYKVKNPSPGNPASKMPSGLKGYALQEWTQLTNARKQNEDAANLSAYWGMFQIGGFNYARCGCGSVGEFVSLMCDSELEQLELFAAFIKNCGMLDDLRSKNWAAFARKYNGAGYAKRGYHTKMATAYKRYAGGEGKPSSDGNKTGAGTGKTGQTKKK